MFRTRTRGLSDRHPKGLFFYPPVCCLAVTVMTSLVLVMPGRFVLQRPSFKPEPGKLVQEHLYLYLCISPYIHPYVYSVYIYIYYTCSFVNTWNSLWPLTRTIYFWLYRSIFCMSSSPQPIKTDGCPPQSVSVRGFFRPGSFSSPLSRHAWFWKDPLVFLFDCANHFETPLDQQS